MKIILVCLTATLLSCVIALPAFASDTAAIMELGENGAFIRTAGLYREDSCTMNYSTGAVLGSEAGLRWMIGDEGLYYIPTRVALGARGTLALYGCYLNNERAKLLSTTTPDEAEAPIWEDTGLYECFSEIYVDASEEGDRFVTMAQFPEGGNLEYREVRVFGYSSQSCDPDWTYIFPMLINSGSRVRMTPTGSLVAAVLSDNYNESIEIAILDGGTGELIFSDSITGDFIRVLDMTEDGSLLYLHEGGRIKIYDTILGELIYDAVGSGSFDSHTIAGDGSRFAYGGFGTLKCYEWNGSEYVYSFTHYESGTVYCARCDFSADGNILAAAFYNYGTGLDFSVISLNGVSGSVNFEADFTGSGSYQNVPSAIRVSRDGSRIVYGGWGDMGNTNAEVMVFEDSGVPVATIDTPGSVFDADISEDGVYVVSGSKAVHANEMGKGGDLACLYMGGEELYFEGVPRLSNSLTFFVDGDPGESVLLAGSLKEVEMETPWGTLRIDPDNYVELGEQTIPQSGTAEFVVPVPGAQALAGKKVVVQALIEGDRTRHLTNAQSAWLLP